MIGPLLHNISEIILVKTNFGQPHSFVPAVARCQVTAGIERLVNGTQQLSTLCANQLVRLKVSHLQELMYQQLAQQHQ